MNKWTRRALITAGGLVGGGLLLGAGTVAFAPNRIGLRPDRQREPGQLATWVKILPDDTVVVLVPHAELGQGAQTALAMMLADELDADWSRVRMEPAPPLPAYANGHVIRGFLAPRVQVPEPLVRSAEYVTYRLTRAMDFQITGGSASVRGTGQFGMRVAGAAAREMLIAAAARRWAVPEGECVARASRVLHEPTGRQASYGELASDAARLSPRGNPRLKARREFTIMGTARKRFDLPSKVDGSAQYAVDVRLPGMLYATVAAAPVHGGRLESVDASPAEQLPGVKRVVRLEQAVAVVADSWWRARQGLAALAPKFGDGGAGAVDSAAWFARHEALLDAGGGEEDVVAGDATQALRGASQVLEARYRVPFLHHATMEPMSATVQLREGRCDVWTGAQDPLNVRRTVAEVLALDPDRVTVHNLQVGGGFGRRLPNQYDYIEQAARIAKEMAPAAVKLMWSREEDTQHGFYRPAVSSRFRGAVTSDGAALVWENRYTGAQEGSAARPPYRIPNLDIRNFETRGHLREGPWRSVAFSYQGYFVESFVDELAVLAKRDPYEFRRAALTDPRHRAVLEKVAAMSGWTKPLAVSDGLRRGRGIALVESFGTIIAEVCEVSVDETGHVGVPRVWAAVDCGIVVDPSTAAGQVEGAILYGLSAALGEQITLESGRVVQGNFGDYPLLRFDAAPHIEVSFVDSDAPPGGLGEPGTPPIAAALCNAVFAATGIRIRELPLSHHRLART